MIQNIDSILFKMHESDGDELSEQENNDVAGTSMQESKLREGDDEDGDGTNNVLAIFKKR